MGSSSMGQARAAGHPTPLLPLSFFDPAYGGRTSILVQPLVSYSHKVPSVRCPEHTWARELKLPRQRCSLTQAQRTHLPTVCAPQRDHELDACTTLRLGCASAAFGRCTSSTPCLEVAVICSAFTAALSRKRRQNVPDARSLS